MNSTNSVINSSSEVQMILGQAIYTPEYNSSYAACQTLFNLENVSPALCEGCEIELFYSNNNNVIKYSQVFNQSVDSIVPFAGTFKLDADCGMIQFGAVILNNVNGVNYTFESYPVYCTVFGYNSI